MSRLLSVVILALSAVAAHADETVRLAPLTQEQLSPEQRAWADAITAPPRNARFTNAPYRGYIRSIELANKLTPLSDYVRWRTSIPARLSEMAILITAREWSS